MCVMVTMCDQDRVTHVWQLIWVQVYWDMFYQLNTATPASDETILSQGCHNDHSQSLLTSSTLDMLQV